MLYRILPNRNETSWFLGEPMVGRIQLDAREFTSAKPYEGPLAGLVIPRDRRGGPSVFSFGAFDMPVVTDPVRSALDEMVRPYVQWVPTRVEGASASFFIMNVLAAPDCIDELRTEGSKWPATGHRADLVGRYRGVVRLVLDEQRAKPFKMFRVGGWEVALIVDHDLMKVVSGLAEESLLFEPVT